MSAQIVFLRAFGLFPRQNISRPGFSDTLHVLLITFLFIFVALPAGAKCFMDRREQDLNNFIINLHTSLDFMLFATSYLLLAWNKIKLRDLICEIREEVGERKKSIDVLCKFH